MLSNVHVDSYAQGAFLYVKYVAMRMSAGNASYGVPHLPMITSMIHIIADVVVSCALNAQEDLYMTVQGVRNVTPCRIGGGARACAYINE